MSVILGWLTSKLAGPIAASIAALFAVGFAWQTVAIDGVPIVGGGYKAQVASLRLQVADDATAQAKFAAQANAAVLAAQSAQRLAQDKVASAYQNGINASQTVTQTIIRKVPVYVSQKSDAACIVPLGAIRLFDAAASGTDPSIAAALIAPGSPDDAASAIPLSDFVAMLAQNFGTGRDNADQLKALETAVTPGSQ